MPADTANKRYESPELASRWFLIGLLLGAAALFLVGFGLMRLYLRLLHNTDAQGAPRSIAAGQLSETDAPPLQPQQGHDQLDAQDLAEMRAHESAVFDRLGWTWDEAAQRRIIPAAVIDAVRHRAAATQSSGISSAARGAK